MLLDSESGVVSGYIVWTLNQLTAEMGDKLHRLIFEPKFLNNIYDMRLEIK